jgi:hypothetical protein
MDTQLISEQAMTAARMLAAQCWCDQETRHKVMDEELCEAFARRLAPYVQRQIGYGAMARLDVLIAQNREIIETAEKLVDEIVELRGRK